MCVLFTSGAGIMGRPKKKSGPKQGPPVTFRPGPELESLVGGFAAGRGLRASEAFKDLAALAAVGLDARHYDLVAHLAAGVPGRNAFVRAVLRLHEAMAGARRVRPDLAGERPRTEFLVATVEAALAAGGRELPPGVVRELAARLGLGHPPGAGGETGEAEFESSPVEKAAEAQKVYVRRGD